LPLVRNGYRLVYDPTITVLHHIAPRKDGDINQRGGFEPKSLADFVHNETLALIEHLRPFGRAAFLTWSLLIGTHFTPGIASAIRNLAKGHTPATAWGRFVATQRGRLQGLATWWRDKPAAASTEPYPHQAEAAP
jgi:hypothetical protein